MLAAYCFYGPDAYSIGTQIRHKETNTLDVSKNNILLGTSSQNQLDKPVLSRTDAAKAARASQIRQGYGAELTPAQVFEVRDFYSQFEGKKPPNGTVTALAKKLGVNRNALAAIKSGKTWSYI